MPYALDRIPIFCPQGLPNITATEVQKSKKKNPNPEIWVTPADLKSTTFCHKRHISLVWLVTTARDECIQTVCFLMFFQPVLWVILTALRMKTVVNAFWLQNIRLWKKNICGSNDLILHFYITNRFLKVLLPLLFRNSGLQFIFSSWLFEQWMLLLLVLCLS